MNQSSLFNLNQFETPPEKVAPEEKFDDDPAFMFPCVHDWIIYYQGSATFDLVCRDCGRKDQQNVDKSWMNFDYDSDRVREVLAENYGKMLTFGDVVKLSHRGLTSVLWNLEQLINQGRVRCGVIRVGLLKPPPKVKQQKLPLVTHREKLTDSIENTPSKIRRDNGEGSGFIQERLSQGKYKQYYFCWEEGKGKNRQKRSRYIRNDLLGVIKKMNEEKEPIAKILEKIKPSTS